MIEVRIPGSEPLLLDHLVLDYNGTLACDGDLVEGVGDCLRRLADSLAIHVITADTFGGAKMQLADLPVDLTIIVPDRQDEQKRDYVVSLAGGVAAIGNGRNDNLMLAHAALGIGVILKEGASAMTLQAADIVCTDILSALELLFHPKRLVATLRR